MSKTSRNVYSQKREPCGMLSKIGELFTICLQWINSISLKSQKVAFSKKSGNLMEICGSNHFFTENLNGPYGPYEHILQDRSSKYWPQNRVFDENWKFRAPKNWKMSFETQNQTFEIVPSSKMMSKYILDHSRVILTQFPYVKIVFLMKIDENR